MNILLEALKKIIWQPKTLWRLLTPDVTKEQREEMARSKALAAAREVIIAEARRQQAKMHRDMTQVAQEIASTEHKAVDGLGELIARIPEEVYFQQRAMHGDNCWQDPDFMKSFLRDNPQCRVRVSRGTRGQEYAGHGRNGKASKFSKGGLIVPGG